MLVGLSYVSKPTRDFDDIRLADLWSQCVVNNSMRDVTGMLYFGGEFFFQTLEGEEETITSLFQTILADPRHADVQTLARNPLANRVFHDWSMKLIDGRQFTKPTDAASLDMLTKASPREIHRETLRLASL